ncbi:hypothetical protein RJT34_24930 [Clitoria ternatea]|uniref:Leucine-rich repeat-containing N-terminal plant-type domain-containing protein n=1 Tax=Clitoria ternatea TaxID=43366 RepID=A0AAN9FRN2_CLITE
MDTFPSNIKLVLLWLLCSIMMFNSAMCSNLKKVHCNEKDMNRLLHFKHEVIDPSGMLSSWLTELDCCEWTGIMCDNTTGRVTQLHLPCHTNHSSVIALGEMDDKSHCLTGEFNLISLLQLRFLSYLNLSNNDFKAIHYEDYVNTTNKCDNLPRGTPYHMCGNSSNLHYLDLSYNYDIVIDNLLWIPHLSSLQYLNLSGVHIGKEVNWLQSVTMLPSLLELNLEGCQLENNYPSLDYANFTSLQVLNLANNDFTHELPNWLFNLSCEITHVDLSQNNIHSQLPKTLPKFRSLRSLILSHNYLKGPIPNWLGQLEHLQQLVLSENFFSGPIPTSLGNISSLVVLDLETNDLSGILPNSLEKLIHLEQLLLAYNSLTGIVSERNLLSFSNLKFFSMRSPDLIFDFDPKWVPPFQLKGILLGFIRDKLPLWLFTQTYLECLNITDSNSSFEPLDKFWNFAANIPVLNLVNNTIDGDMSNVLLNSKLVWLVSNNLKGSLPQISAEVVVLCLYNNSLSGSISPLLCHNMIENKNNLIHLDMGYNHLSGELTNCWNDWKSLVHIDLGYNNLTGKIPDSMGSLSNLRFLFLESNELSGEVPFSLKNCQNLCVLDVGHNNLSGVIPSWLGQSVKGIKLRSNQFSGSIPTEICQLHSLMVMDFASNSLSGPVPNCFRNITAMPFDYASTRIIGFSFNVNGLQGRMDVSITMVIKGNELEYFSLMNVIDLSSNNLSASVPSDIYKLTGLQSLNLSHNHLTGSISEEIGNLKPLESLDLSSNHFSGEIPLSMSTLHYVAVLNLSFNDFMGKIPFGTQLGATNLSYIGNPDLCGPPLTKICSQDDKSNHTKPAGEDVADDKYQVYSCFYMGLGFGFATGFLAVLGAIFFNTTCRNAYFGFLYRLYAMLINKRTPSFEILDTGTVVHDVRASEAYFTQRFLQEAQG